MKIICKIPFLVLFLGMMIGLALMIISAYYPSLALLITGLALLHLAGWVMIVRFFLSVVGLFGTVVDPT